METTLRSRAAAHGRVWRRLTPALVALGGLCVLLLPGCPIPRAQVNRVGLRLVAEGLTSPVALLPAPGGSGRLFIVDQVGKIRVVDSAGNLLADPFLDVTDRLVTLDPGGDERGLLGLAFHPDYASNGRFFIFYTAPKGPDTPAGFDSQTHVSEFQVSAADPNRADPTSERILLRIDKPQSNHNGGQLAFGPDGFLYLGTGDGGGANDTGPGHTAVLGNAQDKSKLLGKILRIDVDTSAAGLPYGIPASNPLVGVSGARAEIWAYGFRNPFRFSFDAGGARRLFCGDVGQNLFEEVDIVARGGNYGWNIREGTHCFNPGDANNPPAQCPTVGADGTPLIEPILDYAHAAPQGEPSGTAVIGDFVYRGAAIPGLEGEYLFGDLSRGTADGSLFAATEATDGTWAMRELSIATSADGRIGRFVFGFGQDAARELYVMTSASGGPSGTAGQVYKIIPAP